MAQKNYCPSCGEKLDDNYNICPNCGEKLSNTPSDHGENQGPAEDEQTFLWGLLGFFIPVVGLILFLVWRQDRPAAGNAAGTGALVSVIFWALLLMFLATWAGSMIP